MNDVSIGRFKGVNNKIDMAGLDVLTTGINVDIDKDMKLRRRDGFTSIYSGSVSSLWSNGNQCFFSEGGFLKELSKDLLTTTTLTDIGSNVSYLDIAGRIYIMDGVKNVVLDNGSIRQWGIDTPLTPTVNPVAGNMPYGRYSILITHVALDGRESGASAHASITTDGGIEVRNIVQPAEGFVRLYATSTNGNTFYRVADLKNGQVTAVFDGSTSDAVIEARFTDAPPSGHVMCFFKGRIFIGVGDTLYYSEPMQYERFDLAYNYIRMDGYITMLGTVNDGIYVGDGQIKFMAGLNPDEFTVNVVAPYDAIEGTVQELDLKYVGTTNNNKALNGAGIIFTTERGVCLGSHQGFLKNMTEDYIALKHGTTGLGLVRRRNGMVQYLSLISGDTGKPVNTYVPNVGNVEIRR